MLETVLKIVRAIAIVFDNELKGVSASPNRERTPAARVVKDIFGDLIYQSVQKQLLASKFRHGVPYAQEKRLTISDSAAKSQLQSSSFSFHQAPP
ncbi:MAG: hypothetical protein QOG91_66 [Candidatus Parcubacteria bacterium]|jgi:hypothetical protein|nr:hypothetical protein [Candidatus Parcubacteria bacterium]